MELEKAIQQLLDEGYTMEGIKQVLNKIVEDTRKNGVKLEELFGDDE
jgi:SOS response regulatory protein OraA/RecX